MDSHFLRSNLKSFRRNYSSFKFQKGRLREFEFYKKKIGYHHLVAQTLSCYLQPNKKFNRHVSYNKQMWQHPYPLASYVRLWK